MAEVNNCIDYVDGELVKCEDYDRCWERGRLKSSNLCGYTPPRPATKEDRPKWLR